jgi:hypothetical protein
VAVQAAERRRGGRCMDREPRRLLPLFHGGYLADLSSGAAPVGATHGCRMAVAAAPIMIGLTWALKLTGSQFRSFAARENSYRSSDVKVLAVPAA